MCSLKGICIRFQVDNVNIQALNILLKHKIIENRSLILQSNCIYQALHRSCCLTSLFGLAISRIRRPQPVGIIKASVSVYDDTLIIGQCRDESQPLIHAHYKN